MPNDYAGMRDEYDKRFDPPKRRTYWIPFDGALTPPGSAVEEAVCERCGCVPVPPDFICAGLCEACNEDYCDEHADDPDPEPGRRYSGLFSREWTDEDWREYAKYN